MSGNLTAEKDNEEKRKQFFLPFSVDRILQIDRDCSKRTKIDYETCKFVNIYVKTNLLLARSHSSIRLGWLV